MTTQPPDLKKLREVAMAATPGPWHQHALMVSASDKYISRGDDICHCGLGMRPNAEINQSESNAEFIATFNPQTILALLDAYEASARDAERWRYACSELTQRYGDGYTEPRECSMSLEWTQGAWIRDGSNDGLGRPDTFPGWSAIVDGMIEEQKRQLDDLDEPDAIDAGRHATQGD